MQTPDGSRVNTDRIADQKGAPLQRIKADVVLREGSDRVAATTGSPAASNGPQRGSVDRHRRLPGHGDGQPGRVRRRRRLLDRRRQRQRLERRGLRLRPGHPGAGRRRRACPDARNAMAVGAVDGQIVATGGWAAAGPSPDTWVYDPAGDSWTAAADAPVSLSASGSGGRRRQAVRRRWLHDLGLHADVERRGGVRPGVRHLGAAGRLPGGGGVRVLRRDRRDGLLHRRQRRRSGDGGQLRLRPGLPTRGPRSPDAPVDTWASSLHRGQRHAPRQRRCRRVR